MRDIRNDLRERLADLDRKQAHQTKTYQAEILRIEEEHRAAIKEIETERAALKQLLAIEDHRSATSHNFTMCLDPRIPLAEFLIAKVSTCGRMGKEALRSAAEEAGYVDGRTFHTTLMNITKGRRLHQNADGSYVLPPLGDGALFESSLTKEEDMRFN